MNRYAAFIFLLLVTPIFGQIRLPRLISDGLVLQRDKPVKLWGWASAGETITLTFKGKSYPTKADQTGNWQIQLPAQSAGGPFEMVFKGSNEVKIQDVLFGDVWICSGQSNMELPMERVKEKYSSIIQTANQPTIRQFLVPDKYDFKKTHTDLESGSWVTATPQNVLSFSAVAYFFARELQTYHNVPIGLVNSALGGSPVEAWISEDALKPFPKAYEELQKFKNDSLIQAIEASDRSRTAAWYQSLNQTDMGITSQPRWTAPELNDSDWAEMSIPGYWADGPMGKKNGAVWFRKTITIPSSFVGKPVKLWMGRIVDQDSVFVNGQFVGTTGYQYPPRRYEIKPGILKEGQNTIVVRVINNADRGGFIPDKPYYLAVGADTIDLKGTWKYKLGTSIPPLQSQTFIRWKPAGLYNNMIAPLLNLSIKGVIWYQGEANANAPQEYAQTFPAMIKNWRDKWHQGDFPFLFVQLANFMEEKPTPQESNWAKLRQSQDQTLSLPNTGMAVTIDLGEWNDIHPLNKQDVGKRLALQARKIAYGEKNLVASGPTAKQAIFKPNQVTITFQHTGNGLLTRKNAKLNGFAISSDGKNFVWADAEIKGNTVVVSNKTISNPTIVRYAWADNPATANLINKEGLPATPFELKKK
ncbi:sialate O-acetylesterase [Xanthocytophaga flava]|uniref:sialate O-acetylesterase n=1 Tax=Xanthocytophaga flava TaxID=3048013 RepID=UPI0028D87ED1|nr:sialate O-acetylesterase [Xanthocytophaga flavus]MDJ1472594.1 sialate O-acetylesterase [Xanthocytophaga flavus]